jgi:hypothetical protein
MGRFLLPAACALFALLSASAAAQVEAEVFSLDGAVTAGALSEVNGAGELVIRQQSGRKEISFGNVHMIRILANQASGAAVREEPASGVLLPAGNYLTGSVLAGDADGLSFGHPLLGEIEIPIDAIRMFLPGEKSIPADFSRYPPAAAEDVVYRKREGALGEDYIGGTVDMISAKVLSFECSLGLVEFPLDQLNAVVIAGEPEPERNPAGVETVILLGGGTGRLSGEFKGLRAGSLSIVGPLGEERAIPLEAIDTVVFHRATYTFLSDLEPNRVEETPYLGSPRDFLYPYRRDRSVSNRELCCGSVRFARGLGVHSRCALTYALEGGYSSFHSFAGVSNEVLRLRARGSILFRVTVDGRAVYESPVLRGGDAVLRLPSIPVKGAKSLTLEVDFADAFDSGDRGFWGHALLVR